MRGQVSNVSHLEATPPSQQYRACPPPRRAARDDVMLWQGSESMRYARKRAAEAELRPTRRTVVKIQWDRLRADFAAAEAGHRRGMSASRSNHRCHRWRSQRLASSQEGSLRFWLFMIHIIKSFTVWRGAVLWFRLAMSLKLKTDVINFSIPGRSCFFAEHDKKWRGTYVECRRDELFVSLSVCQARLALFGNCLAF